MSDDMNAAEFQETVNEQEMREQLALTGGFPEAPNKDSLLKFMRDVVNEEDHIKLARTANLKDEEIGVPRVPSLTYFELSEYADMEGYGLVGVYLRGKVGALAGLSLSRKAKLLESLFTTRKETRNLGVPRETKKKSWFGEETTKEGVDI